jgi:hypothetical protein
MANRDNFGESSEVNRGILEAHEPGIRTSANLVRWAVEVESAAYSGSIPASVLVSTWIWGRIYRFDGRVAAYEVVPLHNAAKFAQGKAAIRIPCNPNERAEELQCGCPERGGRLLTRSSNSFITNGMRIFCGSGRAFAWHWGRRGSF